MYSNRKIMILHTVVELEYIDLPAFIQPEVIVFTAKESVDFIYIVPSWIASLIIQIPPY
jgi:hypothetical protein